MPPKNKTPKKPEPTAQEEQALYDLMFDSMLFQCHPLIVHNVREGVAGLLRILGRVDLIPLWGDTDLLATRGNAASLPG